MARYAQSAENLEYLLSKTDDQVKRITILEIYLDRAHQNGLLEAAEQDEKEASILGAYDGAGFDRSADMHRQAAEKLKP